MESCEDCNWIEATRCGGQLNEYALARYNDRGQNLTAVQI
jgi:hypothetical protein